VITYFAFYTTLTVSVAHSQKD